MRGTLNTWVSAGAFAALLLCGSAIAAARAESRQYGGQSQTPKPTPQPAQQQNSKPANPAPLSMDSTAAVPPSPEEEKAYKAITDTPETDSNKKIQLSEDFLQKYPQSRYRGPLYQALVSGYFATQQVAKLLDIGDKELAMNPNDAPVLAVMAQTIARSFNAKAPDAAQQLAKAEEYSKRAIEVTPTLPKPDNLTDEAFATAKNDTLGMAHGGLGLVYVRRAKYAEAISELEQSIKADTRPQPDPVNYYLLGLANDKTSHFSAAATAFTKCASIQSSLQPTCKNLAEESKKHGETQLSAPN
jgi:tetratricopeptide (TPR) repeat protein